MNRLLFFLCFVRVCSCGAAETAAQPREKPSFSLPEIPPLIARPEDRALYLAQHYWDRFDFAEKAWIDYPIVLEQALVDYIDVLNLIPPQDAQTNIAGMMRHAEKGKTTFRLFGDLCEKYLYNADSPFWDEELYIPVLECLIASPDVTGTEKLRLRYRLEQATKNCAGTIAADFAYAPNANLHALKAAYTLLIFYNPECRSCTQIINTLKLSEPVNTKSRQGKLAILAFYPENNPVAWKQYSGKIPSAWVNGYDRSGFWETKGLYDLRAMPTLFLLDESKKVILKNTTLEKIEQFFSTKDKD